MKNLLILSVFLFLNLSNLCLNASGQTVTVKDSILNKIKELKEQTHVKSLLAGIRKGDREILTIALGESMTSVPAATDMHLRIGGVSETFLGTLLMILSDQGKIDLNDKISKWLPELLAADKVTPEMLIKNTSGYKDYVVNKDFLDVITKDPFRNISREEIISYATRDGELNFTPGTDQKYSHTDFTILGKVLEKATGKSMPELYKEYIFLPLGLEMTGYCINSDLPSPVLHAFSSDRKIYEDATFWNPSWTGESGPLYSTIPELLKWGSEFGKGKLLTPDSFKKLVSRTGDLNKPELYMGSGFVVADGWYVQNPSFNGYSGAFGYLPSEELTIIIFTTQSEDLKSDAQAFQIFRELVKMITPGNLINFN
jgi:CubicO group peptidase (beta-lactamase class C family)